MITQGVHHVSFAVSDLDASRRFYEGVLGLEPIERPDLGLPGVWYRAGALEVHLIAKPEGFDGGHGPEKLTPLANHCAFAIVDYASSLEAVNELGLEVVATSPAMGQMWIRDPDGNVIELIAPRPPR